MAATLAPGFAWEGALEENLTATPFLAVVGESIPYQFVQCVAQDVRASVRLTHLVYTPPRSVEEWTAYVERHPERRDPPKGGSPFSVAAKVRSLGMGGTVQCFTIASFPLDAERVPGLGTPGSGSASAMTTVRLDKREDTVLPRPTDVAGSLDVRLDVDGSVELEVEGPGTVTFIGEQLSALIPEWMNHHMFHVGEDDEEDGSDMDEDDLMEMFRLAR